MRVKLRRRIALQSSQRIGLAHSRTRPLHRVCSQGDSLTGLGAAYFAGGCFANLPRGPSLHRRAGLAALAQRRKTRKTPLACSPSHARQVTFAKSHSPSHIKKWTLFQVVCSRHLAEGARFLSNFRPPPGAHPGDPVAYLRPILLFVRHSRPNSAPTALPYVTFVTVDHRCPRGGGAGGRCLASTRVGQPLARCWRHFLPNSTSKPPP